jgi:hypothetical protein
LSTDLGRLDPLVEGRNGVLHRLIVIGERRLALFIASLCHGPHLLGNLEGPSIMMLSNAVVHKI